MERFLAFAFRFAAGLLFTGLAAAPAGAETIPTPAVVQPAPVVPTQPPATGQFAPDEIIETGHHFFGSISRGLATVVEKAVSQWGLPNGYILGEEAGGAFVGGVRYGDGKLYYQECRRRAGVLAGAIARL